MTTGRRSATTQVGTTATELRREFVAGMVAAGTIRSEWVRHAFEAVPREVFVPRFHRWAGGRQVLVDGAAPGQQAEWLHGVYADQVLTVQLTATPDVVDPDGVPTSSSSMPTVMAGMLDVLDLRDGMRVLEVGTGTGYNAALLSHRVGDENVTSIELDSHLADAARTALSTVGLYPAVHVGDGAAGVPGTSSFDRIIATAAIDHIPPAWITQLAPGGVIVADLRGSLAGGIVRLSRNGDDDEVVGPFAEVPGAFMPMRTRNDRPYRDGEDWGSLVLDECNPQIGRTELDPAVLGERSFRLFLQFQLAGRRLRDFVPSNDRSPIASGAAVDASWFDVDHASEAGRYVVRQGGPQRLWDSVEVAHATWQRLGRPEMSQFTVVADAYVQHIRYTEGDVQWQWPLPL